jgi:hypothetical protein
MSEAPTTANFAYSSMLKFQRSGQINWRHAAKITTIGLRAASAPMPHEELSILPGSYDRNRSTTHGERSGRTASLLHRADDGLE